jgi:hypothetical protein
MTRSRRSSHRAGAALAVVAAGVLGLAGCASGPVGRAALCAGFDELGSDMTAANGFFDNAVFSSAGDLADLTGRYRGADLSTDSSALDRIADSDETTGSALRRATAGTAKVCGHPFGVGTTSGTGTGGTPAYGGSGGDPTTYAPPTPYAAPPTPEPAPPATDGPAGETAAQAMLRQQADSDRPRAEAVGDRWVPQLSSKNAGLVADGTIYDHAAIWADFAATRQAHPTALLLWSGDYRSFTKGDFWVTVAGTSFATGAEANAWCAAEHLDADHCFAKLVSHTHGSRGSTLPRK